MIHYMSKLYIKFIISLDEPNLLGRVKNTKSKAWQACKYGLTYFWLIPFSNEFVSFPLFGCKNIFTLILHLLLTLWLIGRLFDKLCQSSDYLIAVAVAS